MSKLCVYVLFVVRLSPGAFLTAAQMQSLTIRGQLVRNEKVRLKLRGGSRRSGVLHDTEVSNVAYMNHVAENG